MSLVAVYSEPSSNAADASGVLAVRCSGRRQLAQVTAAVGSEPVLVVDAPSLRRALDVGGAGARVLDAAELLARRAHDQGAFTVLGRRRSSRARGVAHDPARFTRL